MDDKLSALLQELKHRKSRPKFDLSTFLFREQYQFVSDPSPFKTAVCTRRSGKTVGCAADLADTGIKFPEANSLYITLSRNNAKKLVWPEIKRINREFMLGAMANESELSITFPNSSVIYCSGASDKTEIEKFRGLALKKVYLDESQSFPPYIKELVDDIISPALMDYAGTLCLIGTPGPIPAGFFYDCAHNAEWSHHEWTFFSNPYIALKSGCTHKELLDRELKRRGVTIEDPSIQREWFGKWVLDSTSLVFKYNEQINHFPGMPHENGTYILGIDFGYEDNDAIAVLYWSEKTPITYLVEEVITPKQGITPLVEQINKLTQKYRPSKIIADFGALGKKIGEEIIRRHSIPLEPAEKSRKNESIELLNDAMRRGHLKAKKDSRFASDCMLVEWDKERSTPERKVISDRFHSDICDAVLYAFRFSPAFAWRPEVIKPIYGTPDWAKEEVQRMEEDAENHFKELDDIEKAWNF